MNVIADFTVRPGVWDSTVKIDEVKRRRHTVIFPEEEEPSQVSFCNNCAEAFVIGNRCANCGMEQEENPAP